MSMARPLADLTLIVAGDGAEAGMVVLGEAAFFLATVSSLSVKFVKRFNRARDASIVHGLARLHTYHHG